MRVIQKDSKIVIELDEPQDRVYTNILVSALRIYADRKSQRGGGWRRYGAMGAAFFVKDRSNRIWDALQANGKFMEEDAVDIINYAAFALISQDEGNLGGEFWPDRPVAQPPGEDELTTYG